MQKKLADFAAELGIAFTQEHWQKLNAYADLIWQKKDQLNLTSVAGKGEIFTRHLADGMACAAVWKKMFADKLNGTAADMGSGAGYIGITLAILCPQVKVTLVESLQKRCAFLNWVILKLALTNVEVKNVRVGQTPVGKFDLVTERAMGPLEELIPILADCIVTGGILAAYQSQLGEVKNAVIQRNHLQIGQPFSYILPGEEKERYLMVLAYGHR